ncbi:NAD+ synthase [Thiotrichales bacterium 19S3-7]|nr:NAD+ synthase [Thiotrichales bacterium 19S3-7]MCF6801402.1 NAD+ synthase [Thiotrichales bacterium 19S3-11]
MNVTIAQLDYIIGNFKYNYQKIRQVIIEKAHETDLIVFSELALSGYYVFDLVERKGFIAKQNDYLAQLLELSKQYNCVIILGCITENVNQGKQYHNSALVIYLGEIIYTYHKQLLPSYNIFNEPRHFHAGDQLPIFEHKGKKIGILICEDLWDQNQKLYSHHPIEKLKNHVAELDCVVTLNSSPSEYNKHKRRVDLLSQLAVTLSVPCFYVNQVGGYDDIVYDGASFLVSKLGQLKDQLPSFVESVETVTADTQRNSSLVDYVVAPKAAFFLEQMKLGLYDYVNKCQFKGVVIALSGGIDSALTLVIATLALGPEQVHAITMPSIYSSEGSVKDSEVLCQNLGVKLYNRAIAEDYQLSCRLFNDAFNKQPSRLTCENMQARIRGRIVMEYANEFGLLVISCGNKSELSVGYATLYGDMNGGINIIGDLYKTDVYEVANYINMNHDNIIPRAIIEKAPSAELSEDQKDSDSLPDYDLLDAVLKLSIEGDLLDDDELAHLKQRASALNEHEIREILTLIDKAEFKRKQAPPIIRLQHRSFGAGRMIPIAHQFATGDWQLEAYGAIMCSTQ